MRRIFVLGVCVGWALACTHTQYTSTQYPSPTRVNLEPNDPRPVYTIPVGDELEAGLLQQELGVAPLRLEGTTLYFHDTPGVREKLAEYGYTPVQANPYGVYSRVVRIARRGEERELAQYDVELINREREYWVARGSLGALRALAAAGYRLEPVQGDEPRPRIVRIDIRDVRDVQRISEIGVDVFSVERDPRQTPVATTAPLRPALVVFGGAFDAQIDALRAAGFTVEFVDVPDGGKP